MDEYIDDECLEWIDIWMEGSIRAVARLKI